MILISSAAYIEQDLAYEVGRLPPSFLPIGNRRLYEHQVNFVQQFNKQIYLSLPESFSLPTYDNKRLKELGVKIIVVPDGLTLGNSILYCWSATGLQHECLTILHGDTLFLECDIPETDVVSAHINRGAYSRARVSLNGGKQHHYSSDFVEDGQLVLSGLFKVSRPQLLMQGILHNKGDFVSGLEHYAKKHYLTEISCGFWLDFGHLNSFFRSRTLITTQRAFNDLKIEPRTVTKASTDKIKMLAESNWFNSLPRQLSLHTPALLAEYSEIKDKATYTLEYLYLLPLSDLFVFGRLSDSYWQYILKAAYDISYQFSSFKPAHFNLNEANKIYLNKTLKRLDLLYNSKFSSTINRYNFNDERCLTRIAKSSAAFIKPTTNEHISIVHGDYCFSNILFDSRTQALKLIDPRGIDNSGEITIFGDRRYDIAKLYHSVIGCYDLIIAGRYKIEGENINFFDTERLNQLEETFDTIFFKSEAFDKIEILAINVHLFISMIPLHEDRTDRQEALLLNAWRLYQKLVELTK